MVNETRKSIYKNKRNVTKKRMNAIKKSVKDVERDLITISNIKASAKEKANKKRTKKNNNTKNKIKKGGIYPDDDEGKNVYKYAFSNQNISDVDYSLLENFKKNVKNNMEYNEIEKLIESYVKKTDGLIWRDLHLKTEHNKDKKEVEEIKKILKDIYNDYKEHFENITIYRDWETDRKSVV